VRVVTRTRLLGWRKAAVADELLGISWTGLAAGATASNLSRGFGNPPPAARLIRRAKQRPDRSPGIPGTCGRLVLRVTADVIACMGLMLLDASASSIQAPRSTIWRN